MLILDFVTYFFLFRFIIQYNIFPETEGKNLPDIESFFSGKNREINDSNKIENDNIEMPAKNVVS